MTIWNWINKIFEARSHKDFRESRKVLHENRHELQRSISAAMESGRKSSKALKVAEHALEILEKQRNERKQ